MSYVKQISVHKSPMSFLEYIMNGDKNSHMKFASGLNCETNLELAYRSFQKTFERYTSENFFKYTSDSKKDKVRLHHYVQSFDPKENITPEQAHQIGLEWAKKVFGTDRQICVSIHVPRVGDDT